MKIWMVHPNIMPPSVAVGTASTSAAPHPPRVEYLATLSKHQAPVNVVRFSPNGTSVVGLFRLALTYCAGELLASAGDGEFSLTFKVVLSWPLVMSVMVFTTREPRNRKGQFRDAF